MYVYTCQAITTIKVMSISFNPKSSIMLLWNPLSYPSPPTPIFWPFCPFRLAFIFSILYKWTYKACTIFVLLHSLGIIIWSFFHVAVYIRSSSLSLNCWAIVYLHIPQFIIDLLIGIWVVSIFFFCYYKQSYFEPLYENILSFLLGKDSGIEQLHYIVGVRLTL